VYTRANECRENFRQPREIVLQTGITFVDLERSLVARQRALQLDLQAVPVFGRPAVLAHDFHALVRIVDGYAVTEAARAVGDEPRERGIAGPAIAIAQYEIGARAARIVGEGVAHRRH